MEHEIYRSAFKHSFHPIFLTLPDGAILDANNAAIQTFGYNVVEIRQIGIKNLVQNNDPTILSFLKTAEKEGRVKGEFTAVRKNKETFHCQYFSVNFINKNGEICCIDTIIDISEQKQNEINLRVEKERYDIITKATSDAIWDWDIVNDKMRYNSGISEMFGYDDFEISNTRNWWRNKIHPDDLQKTFNKINHVLNTKETQAQFKYRFLCSDGTFKYICDRAFIIFDSDKQAIRMIGAMQDMTLITKYILSVRTQNKKLRKISWTQSHIVRAPLVRIMACISLIKSQNTDEMTIPELLNVIERSANELDVVIRDIVKETEENIDTLNNENSATPSLDHIS